MIFNEPKKPMEELFEAAKSKVEMAERMLQRTKDKVELLESMRPSFEAMVAAFPEMRFKISDNFLNGHLVIELENPEIDVLVNYAEKKIHTGYERAIETARQYEYNASSNLAEELRDKEKATRNVAKHKARLAKWYMFMFPMERRTEEDARDDAQDDLERAEQWSKTYDREEREAHAKVVDLEEKKEKFLASIKTAFPDYIIE